MEKNHINLTTECQNEILNLFLTHKGESFEADDLEDFKKKTLSSEV